MDYDFPSVLSQKTKLQTLIFLLNYILNYDI